LAAFTFTEVPASSRVHGGDRPELAAFLHTRRERLRPQDVGLPDGQRRRTPGLRRQEVAQLASLSVDYYIRLEQARGSRHWRTTKFFHDKPARCQ
jgi:Helix-turn-helix domain